MIKFNPITWNLVFRPLAGIVLGSIYAGLLFALVAVIAIWAEREMSIPFSVWFGLAVVIGALGILPEGGELEKVPETRYLAMVTFLGMPLGWLGRTTGKYPWTGKRLGLGRTMRTTPEFTDQHGFIKAGEIPFQVWNNAVRTGDGESAKGNPIIKAPAKNRAQIASTLTLILQSTNPRRTLDSDDPELDIGDRARQEFREMVGHFVDTDLQHLQQDTGRVLTGHKLVTCFLPKSIHGQKSGGMILDNGGKVMFKVIEQGLSEKAEEAAINEFLKGVRDNADDDMLELITKKGQDGKIIKDADGNVIIKHDEVQVKAPIEEVIIRLGLRLERVTFGDIILSDPVTSAANQASSEMDERIVRIESARTNKQARIELLPDEEERKNPLSELAMVLEAAADDKTGSVQVVMVPGGNSLAQAAVAGASQLNKGKGTK